MATMGQSGKFGSDSTIAAVLCIIAARSASPIASSIAYFPSRSLFM